MLAVLNSKTQDVCKVHPIADNEGPEGSRGIAILFLEPRRYVVVGGQCHAPAALLPERDPVAIV